MLYVMYTKIYKSYVLGSQPALQLSQMFIVDVMCICNHMDERAEKKFKATGDT